LLALPKQQLKAGLYSAFASYLFFIFIFNDFYQTNYLNIYRTDLWQIFRFGRTVAVGDQSEISVSIP